MLQEQDKLKLDGIVQQMISNKESDSNIQLVVNDFKQKYSQAQPILTETKPYIDRVGSMFMETGKNLISNLETQGNIALSEANKPQNLQTLIRGTGSLLRSGLRTAGDVAGTAGSLIAELPGIKESLEFVAGNLSKDRVASNVISKITEFSKNNPELSKDLGAITNILTLGTGKTVEAPLAKTISQTGKDIITGTEMLLKPSEQVVQNKIIDLFNKSIKPTPQKTLTQANKYKNNVIESLKTIKNNSDQLNIEDVTGEIITGRTPQSISELGQALDQTKDIVFKKYDDLAKSVGQDIKLNAGDVSKEVDTVINNKALQLTNPEVIAYAKNWQTRLKDFGDIDVVTTQEVIKNLNNGLKAFYRNPTYDSASKIVIDAGIANNFRKSLDDIINKSTGKNYQVLKDQYASLKAIENDIIRAVQRDARKNIKGLLDYTDIFTGGQMLSGILSLNPAMFTKGALERGIKEYIKVLNDPNRAVKNMFDSLNKLK